MARFTFAKTVGRGRGGDRWHSTHTLSAPEPPGMATGKSHETPSQRFPAKVEIHKLMDRLLIIVNV